MSPSSARSIAKICSPSSASLTHARVDPDFYDEDFLFRLVVYTSAHDFYLGVIQDVSILPFESPTPEKILKIRNLQCIAKNGKPAPIRNAPRILSPVYFADESDLERFFPRKKFPERGYLGFVRGTSYSLPLDLDRLCFGNTAILAGIGHGKSYLAALVVSQLHAIGKRVLVIDPSGEWATLMNDLKKRLEEYAKIDLTLSSYDPSLPYPPSTIDVESISNFVFEAFEKEDLVILDISFARANGAEDKLEGRCHVVYGIQQSLMKLALSHYARTKKPYGIPTCIVLEEAHQFVPSKPLMDIQRMVSTIFAISTKEYRKFGLGHIFIDQSLKAISEDLQIQTFLLGATTTPGDLDFMTSRLGKQVVSATQRTIGGAKRSSWVVYGAGTPVTGIPWEIESFAPDDLVALRET